MDSEIRQTFRSLAADLFGRRAKQPRTVRDRVLAVLPITQSISTQAVVDRFALRFNDGGQSTEDLALAAFSGVSRCLCRLRSEGLATGTRGMWKRASKGVCA